ncbi:hypothetical protein Smic_27160 [Streptomyces microflavus]|uniref:Haloacid dehalogenase-like hydrolase n=1 Tax=Streptomyces microflavus TaxID=1919 RepID=A0A7J0CNU4_STRMI|nr:hypothetical protein Smic_27160 [Streptomyces microflavus]
MNNMTSAEQATGSTERTPFGLVVLDMAGTTVADGGLVEQAFSAAAERLGVKPGSGEHERQLGYVRATMGESKISVFRHLFGDEEKAQYANTAFEEAYGALVDGGRIAPIPGAREAVERLIGEGRTVVLTTGFARTTQDAILAALGWQDLVPLTLCPADAGGRGAPTPTWSWPRSCVRARWTTCGGSRWPGTPRTTCSAAYAPAPGSSRES